MNFPESGQRFLIHRPRLMSMLDASQSRILLLLAPAGYGKTTLIRQWLSSGTQEGFWIRTNPASADIAALATTISRTIEQVVPGVEVEVRRHLKSLSKPSDYPEFLGHAMAAAIDTWPSNAWLIIDDYEFLTKSTPAEIFIEALLDHAPIRTLVATRRPPHWTSARRVLYGDITELTQQHLALTETETLELFSELDVDAATIWSRAKGWPAVIRLAALTGNVALPADVLPPALHQYFAEELYQATSTPVQEGLVKLAMLPTLSAALTKLALGDQTELICNEAIELGFLSRDQTEQLELHPLLRTFLSNKFRSSDHDILYDLLRGVMQEENWDDAFTMIVRSDRLTMLPALFELALDPLLEERRVETLETWVATAIKSGCDFPLLLLAEAEISRRIGRFDIGEARALQAAAALRASSDKWVSRAYILAGECAHHDYRTLDAIEHLHHAEDTADDSNDARRAIWGQFIATIQIEGDAAQALLARFEALADGRPATTLRIACGQMMLATLAGGLETALQRNQKQIALVARTDDPLVTSSFLYRVAYTQVATGHYAEGLELATRGDEVARNENLTFALGHVTAAMAAATLGLRQLKRAELLVQRLDDVANQIGDLFELSNSQALRARIQLAQGSFLEAAVSVENWAMAPTPAMQGEGASLRAIALAVLNDFDAARELIALVDDMTYEVQPATLSCMAAAIVALGCSSGCDQREVVAAESILIERQNYDSLVAAYRAFPQLLAVLRERRKIPEERLEALVRDSRDFELAASIGWIIQPSHSQSSLLSPRESQVYELLCRGLTNREIARQLVVAEVTVKVHVRHILEKLKARSRMEAVLRFYEPT